MTRVGQSERAAADPLAKQEAALWAGGLRKEPAEGRLHPEPHLKAEPAPRSPVGLPPPQPPPCCRSVAGCHPALLPGLLQAALVLLELYFTQDSRVLVAVKQYYREMSHNRNVVNRQ